MVWGVGVGRGGEQRERDMGERTKTNYSCQHRSTQNVQFWRDFNRLCATFFLKLWLRNESKWRKVKKKVMKGKERYHPDGGDENGWSVEDVNPQSTHRVHRLVR